MKDPGHDLACCPLESVGPLMLTLQDATERRSKRKHAAYVVLRFAGFKSKPAIPEVNVGPFAGKKFGLHAPSCQVGDLKYWSNVIRQMAENFTEFGFLEESLPHVV